MIISDIQYNCLSHLFLVFQIRKSCDHKVVGFKSTCTIRFYHQMYSLCTLVSSTNKTDHNNITEILLKVALNTISLSQIRRPSCWYLYFCSWKQILVDNLYCCVITFTVYKDINSKSLKNEFFLSRHFNSLTVDHV